MSQDNKNKSTGAVLLPSQNPQINAVLTGYTLGDDGNVQSIERLITASLAQVIYGADIANSIKDINGLKAVARKGQNPKDLLSGILSASNGMYSIMQKLDEKFGKITPEQIKNILKIPEMFTTGINVNVLNQENEDNKKGSSNTLEIILNSSNFVDILTSLAELTGDDEYYFDKMGEALLSLVDSSESLAKAAPNIDEYVDKISKLLAIAPDFSKFAKSLEPFNEAIIGLNMTGDTDFTSLESLSSALENLSSIEFSEDNIDTIISSLPKIVDMMSSLDVSTIEMVPLELGSSLENLVKILPNLREFVENGNTFDVVLTEENINNVTAALNGISKLPKDKIEFDLDITEDFAYKLSNFSEFISNPTYLPFFVKSVNDFNGSFEEKNLDNVINILTKLEKIKFIGGNEINTNNLEKLVKAFPSIDKILDALNKGEDINYLKLKEKTAALSYILSSLEKMKYQPDKDSINVKMLKSLAQNVIKPTIEIFKTFNKDLDEISDKSDKKAESIVKTLIALEQLRYEPENIIDEAAIENLKKIAPSLTDIMVEFDRYKFIKRARRNAKYIISTLDDIGNIDSKKFEGKNFKAIKNAAIAIAQVSSALYVFNADEVADKLPDFRSFVELMITDSDSLLVTTINKMKELPLSKEDNDKIHTAAKLLESIANLAYSVAVVGKLGKAAELGMAVVEKLVDKTKELILSINSIDQKQLDGAIDAMKEVGKLIIYASIAMLIGGAFIVMFPKLIVGALAFGLVLGAFLFITLKAISLASPKETKQAIANMEEVGKLILLSTISMIIGGLFVTANQNLVVGALAFGLVLGAFLLTVLFAIRLVDVKNDLKQVSGIGTLLAACTIVMLIGGLVMATYPKLILGSLAFGLVLGLFLFIVLGAISLAGAALKSEEKNIKAIERFIFECTVLMLVGGVLLLAYPKVIASSLMFGVVLGLYLWGILTAIKKGTKGVKRAEKQLREFSIVIGVAAGVLLAGGGLFMKYPDLIWAVPLFGVIFTGFVFAMTKVLNKLSKNQSKMMKGAIALGILSGVILIASTAMLILRKAVEGAALELLAGVGIMGLALGGVALMAIAIGTTAMNPFFWAGIGALAAISGIILLASAVMRHIAGTMKILEEVEGFDPEPIVNSIKGLMGMIPALSLFGLAIIPLTLGSTAIAIMAGAIYTISKVVSDVSSLKIPIYSGTKIIGYHKLSNTDFRKAAKNTETILTVLGKAIFKVYKKNPLMFAPSFFDTPFTRVAKSATHLGKMMSSIARGVRAMGQLLVADRWDKNGNPIHFVRMSDNDIKQAGVNTASIVTTLAYALIDVYNKDKTLFEDKTMLGKFMPSASRTPLAMVIGVTNQIGKLMSSIARGVQSFGNLTIPIAWDKDGNPVKFKQMKDSDIESARKNVQNIITTLSEALIELYEGNPELYKDKSMLGDFLPSAAKTPLAMVIGVTSKIGKLMSSIARGVQSFGNLTIPIAWNKEGNPINFKQMKTSDIEAAKENVKTIIESLSSTLIGIYKDNKELYTDDSMWGKISPSASSTPLAIVLSVSTKIGKLLSGIASGVQAFGNMLIPTAWNKDGKPISFRQMSSKEMLAAGDNVKSIVTSLGLGLMKVYDEHNDWFDSSKADKTAFGIVMKTNLSLTKIISKISKAVADMAKLSIPIDWDKDGKPIKFESLNEKHFKLASDNIGKVIVTIGSAIMSMYDDPVSGKWFKDEDGDVLKDGKNPFSIVMKSVSSMSNLISNISSSIKNYASLLIPDQWDKEGKAIHFAKIQTADMEEASNNIGLVITTIGESLMNQYKAHEDWFKGRLLGFGDSPFTKVMESTTAMGDMISNIAEGIGNLAILNIPTAWNKDGQPIKFRKLEDKDFKDAGTHINEIVTCIGGKLIELYENDTNGMFNPDGDDTPFTRVATSCANLGDMIIDIAQGVGDMSNLEATLKKQGITLDYDAAAENISKVVSAIGNALMSTFGKHKEWFEVPVEVESGFGWFGLGAKKVTKPVSSDSPFQSMINSCMSMGQLIITIAQGVGEFARIMQVEIPDGQGGKFKVDVDAASKNIKIILCAIGESLASVASSNVFVNQDKVSSVITNVHKAANAVMSVAKLLEKIGTGEIAVTDNKGNVISKLIINEQSIENAATMIGNILNGVSTGFKNAKENEIFKEFILNSSATSTMIDLVDKAIKMVGSNALTLAKLGSGEIPVWNKAHTKIIETIKVTPEDIKNGGERIKNILITVAKGIQEAHNSISTMLGGDLFTKSAAHQTIENVGLAMNIVRWNLETLVGLANETLYLWDKDHTKIVKTINFKRANLEIGASTIGAIVSNIAEAINIGSDKVITLWGSGASEWDKTNIYKVLKAVKESTSTVGEIALLLAHLSNNEYTYYDSREEKLKTIKFESPDKLTTAATTLGTIISNVATNISTSADKAASLFGDTDDFKKSKIHKILESVVEAKNTVGKVAWFLSHLANNEYVYFDSRKQKEVTVQFGALKNLEDAAITTGRIVESLASSISKATDTAYSYLKGDNFEDTKAYRMLRSLGMVSSHVGPIVKLLADIVDNNTFTYNDQKIGIVHSMIKRTSIEQATSIIGSVITSLAGTIEEAANKKIFKDDTQVTTMFMSLNNMTRLVGKLSKIIAYYGENKIVELDENNIIKVSAGPDVETAVTNIKTVVNGIVDIINDTSKSFKKLDDVNKTIVTITLSVAMVDKCLYAVNEIKKASENINSVSSIKFGEKLTPVIDDIRTTIEKLNGLGENNVLKNLFTSKKSAFRTFIEDTQLMVTQSQSITSAPIEDSYSTLQKAITSTMETMNSIQMPQDFKKQVQDLDDFIVSVNKIKIEGVDSLTALIRELNTMGINMGNVDKLAKAIGQDLSKVLKECKTAMASLDKALKEDGERKKKHKKEIERSVTEIQRVLNSTLNVVVTNGDSTNPSGQTADDRTTDDGGTTKGGNKSGTSDKSTIEYR